MIASARSRLSKPPAYRWWILVANMLAYGQFFLTVQVVNAFSSTVQDQWHLATADLALLTTVTLAGYALASAAGGKLQALFGARRTVVGGIVVNVLLAALFPTVVGASYEGMMALRFLQGVAGGCIASSVVSSTTLWFPVRQRGLAEGLLMGVLGFGFALASFFAPPLLSTGMSWQFAAAVLVVAPGAIIAIVYATTVRDLGAVYPGADAVADLLPPDEATAPEERPAARPDTMAQVRKQPRFWAAIVVGFVNGWLTYGFATLLPPLLTGNLGFSGDAVASITSATFVITLIASPLGGILSDRVFGGRRWPVLLVGNAVSVVALVAVPFVPHGLVTAVLVVAYASVSLCCGTFWTLPSELVRPSIAAQSTGFITAVANIGSLLTGFALGALIDASASALPALYLCAALAAVSAISCPVIKQ
ncbi:MFS transporter [Eggerthella timonensis]|uniref:MFS transporter n=1 Tax=Eggerthella timonensis TaxID=1871008 RepID=UPI000C78D717|nr:MFS transporter [Eggerthella timonensis]